jgi:hypothetical protein
MPNPAMMPSCSHALEEARLRNAVLVALGVWRWDLGTMPYEELDQRLSAWRPHYPDVQVSLCAADSGVAAYLADYKDAHVGLVVIGDASADQVARLIGPHIHPLLAHRDCSVLIWGAFCQGGRVERRAVTVVAARRFVVAR